MEQISYSDIRWRQVRARALARDGNACTVSRFFGGQCSDAPLHAHHILSVADGGERYDLANVGTTCAAHHPMWEALRRQLVRHLMAAPPRCPHQHRSVEARAICERRLRQRQAA